MLQRALSYSLVIAALMLTPGCDKLPDWLKNWQKEQLKQRYGSATLDRDKIPEWEKEIEQYEEIINEKVEAGLKTGKIYRKIGEAYGHLDAYQPCVENLEKAIAVGYAIDDVFYSLGLCQGNLARLHNWQRDMMRAAEKTFLKVLKLTPGYDSAKFELGIIYFHGFGRNNRFRVKAGEVTATQKEYRHKGIQLVKAYQDMVPNERKSYFALAGMYRLIGQRDGASSQMKRLLHRLKEADPENFQKSETYKKAEANLRLLETQR